MVEIRVTNIYYIRRSHSIAHNRTVEPMRLWYCTFQVIGDRTRRHDRWELMEPNGRMLNKIPVVAYGRL